MQIREGAYYRTRGERIVGPVRRRDGKTTYPWGDGADCWTDSGRFGEDVNDCDMDLISEVYVSDTPPAPQVNTTKTARDELAEKAALAMQAILNGYYINLGSTSSDEFADMWLAAEHFMEARKK